MPNVQEREILREPYFSIVLNGSAVTEDMLKYVTYINYEDESGKAGIAHITIGDVDRIWMKDSRIVKGAKITIRMGHRDNHRQMLSGTIKNLEADFPQEGYPTFTIVAVDSGANLSAKKKTRSWKNKKLYEVISAILKENGLPSQVQTTYQLHTHIAQSNETDMDFIKRKAKEAGWYFYALPTGMLYFGSKKQTAASTNNLDYRMGNLQIIAFQPSFQEEAPDSSSASTDIDSGSGKTTSTSSSTSTPSKSTQSQDSVAVDKKTGSVKAVAKK